MNRLVMKKWLNGVLAYGWEWGFALSGRIAARTPAHWSSSGRERVLVLAPHPDDEVIGCAGTMCHHRQAGDAVWVMVATDGRQSRAGGLGMAEMIARRRAESQAAAAVLGVDKLVLAGLPEGEWAIGDLVAGLQRLFGQFQPTLMYAPSRVDYHPEHWRVAHALALALPAGAAVRVYQVHVPLTGLLTNLVADTSGVSGRVAQAFAAYASQRETLARSFRLRRYAACYYRLERHGEVFWQLPAGDYQRLHRSRPEQWPPRFRSLRPHALYDPLAYLAGRTERKGMGGK